MVNKAPKAGAGKARTVFPVGRLPLPGRGFVYTTGRGGVQAEKGGGQGVFWSPGGYAVPSALQMQIVRSREGELRAPGHTAWGCQGALPRDCSSVFSALGNRWLQFPPTEAKHFPWLPC